jgi:6-phosphofructokinase 1
VAERVYQQRTGRKKKIIYKQIGYETRNAPPISFDVVLSSMLGYGAFKLYKNGQFGCMVSVSDNFSIVGVPFEQLIDPETLLTRLRNVPKGSDFYELKEALSYKISE